MKLEELIRFGSIGIAVLGGIFLIKILIDKTEADNRNNLDNFFDYVIAEALANKLQTTKAVILPIVQGSSNPELEQKIENIVHSVRLLFKKRPQSSTVEVRLEIDYTDETSLATTVNKDWDEIPATVREQFLRTGNPEVCLPWAFPWKMDNEV